MARVASFLNISLDWLARGHGDMRASEPLSEREAMLLFAFRQLPQDEADLHLNLMLKRVRPTGS